MKKTAMAFMLALPALLAQTPVYYANAIIPQVPVGCGFQFKLILMSLSGNAVNFQVNFWPQQLLLDGNGNPTARMIPIVNLGVVGTISGTVPANGSYTISSDPTVTLPSTFDCSGWAEVNSAEAVGGYVAVQQAAMFPTTPGASVSYQINATVPLAPRFANRFLVPFDTTAFNPGIAVVNPSFQMAAQVNVTYRDASGNTLCQEPLNLGPGEQQTYLLQPPINPSMDPKPNVCGSPSYTQLVGHSGVAEFVTQNLELSGVSFGFGTYSWAAFPAQSPVFVISP
jgi:hypothetical protein